MPGAPDIARAILEKIAAADLIVADISIINGDRDGRRTPNPNVLIELGYALCALGPERVVLNQAQRGTADRSHTPPTSRRALIPS